MTRLGIDWAPRNGRAAGGKMTKIADESWELQLSMDSSLNLTG
jgi:hypothetical protein